MRDILKTIKEHFILLLGAGLFTYDLFSFHSDKVCGEGGLMPAGTLSLQMFDRLKCIEPVIYYYYDRNTLILLSTGVVFIIIGLLKMRKKKGEN